MAGQYPIWVEINSCAYTSRKSYGIKKHGRQEISVGSSSKNSHHFIDVELKKKEIDGKIHFQYYVDDVMIKEMIFERRKDGRAGDLIKTRSKLKSIKSL